jgi:3D (Asp-Asp-Asp) domain-containing protein
MGYAAGTSVKLVQTRLTETTALKRQIEALENKSAKIADYKAQLDTLTQQISALQAEIDRKQDKSDRGEPRGERRIMEVTAYDLSYESCGKLPNHPEYGITASGTQVKEWYTVAAGKELKFGTKVYIPFFADKPNGGVFTVQDRGQAIKNGCIDVYMKSYEQAMLFGRRNLESYVLEDGGENK